MIHINEDINNVKYRIDAYERRVNKHDFFINVQKFMIKSYSENIENRWIYRDNDVQFINHSALEKYRLRRLKYIEDKL